jgi:hypothetical protein
VTDAFTTADSPVLPFGDLWDRALALEGPPAIFTLDPRGQLRLNPERTRDHGRRVADPGPAGPHHGLIRDRATGFVLYAFATGAGLLQSSDRDDIRLFDSQPAALAALAALGRPPLRAEPWADSAPPTFR